MLEPDTANWQGPFESSYGFHLVLLVEKKDARYPEIDEIRETVRYDAERDAVNAQKNLAIDAIVSTYEVRRDLE